MWHRLSPRILTSEELRRKKGIKLAIYIAAFAVFQTIVTLVFALTVMRVRTPKNFNTGTRESPSFDLSFTTQIGVKNTNFFPYKFDSTIATFMYEGVPVGQVIIPKVNVNSNALPTTTGLGSELGAGVLTLNSQAKLNGKMELMFVMKKKKSTEMNSTMTIDLSTKAVLSMICD
ncbi:hypothetical protein RGQ29_010848 [Quercus rubra]|uniref:Late embryogenesis abundant protein LEA-2 subgroup domain-containing protein n=1 Tax=Quercus rubra TaxID=3512 RepID=A0AAN7J7Y7_QUERU|nr:hypothetical protein RGQ29_010848 [Quercus rubra]